MTANVSIPGAIHRTYSFGEFTLDLDRGALLRAGVDVKLRPKSFEVLSYLVQRHGLLVAKNELLDAIWGQTVVTEESVAHCLSDIRKAIHDQSQEMIRTVPRRGYIFDIPVTKHGGLVTKSDAPSSSKLASNWPRWSLAAALFLVLGVTAVWWWFGNRGIDVAVTAGPKPMMAPHSIAVLPFLDMSPERDQAYFADGISEEILNLLAKVPELRVISRSSAFSFKGKNIEIPTVAQQLNVAYVLEGSVRRAGSQVRISAQLIEARSDTHLWSQTYDRNLDNIFQIQDEIATSVVDALKIKLLGATPQTRKIDKEAYTLALQAKYFWNRKSPGDEERAMKYYQQTLDINPSYAPAWAGLSASYMVQVEKGQISRETGLAKAREAAEMALSLDPDLSDAHVRMGIVHHDINLNREAAFEEYRQALSLDPNNPLAMAVMSSIWREGRLDEAINWYKKAAIVDPLTTTWRTNMSYLLIKAGRVDEAEEAARKALELSPEENPATLNLAVIFLLRGQLDEALELIQSTPESTEKTLVLTIIYHAMGRQDESDAALMQLTRTAEGEDEGLLLIAQAHACRGEVDKAFEWLDKANDAQHKSYGTNIEFGVIKFEPFLESLHDDPRWDALLDNLDTLH
jgi:TolB-like protein/DNA-binding winged helix-turn-helix (wHTH) protein/Tfp pilus assembly protein PilF